MSSGKLYILCEHATGYALFYVKEVEEIGATLAQVEQCTTEVNRFKSMVSLSAFTSYRTSEAALDNVNCITEGILHDDLHTFLETNLPAKRKHLTLGVGDAKLGQAINAGLAVKCAFTAPVPELLRGVRLFFHHLVASVGEGDIDKAQVGLSHSVSRSRVKFNVNRADNMIIQGIKILDQVDKDVNQFTMRIREWYSYHFPELIKIVKENHTFIKLVLYIGNRKRFLEECGTDDAAMQERVNAITEIVQDAGKTEEIFEALKTSMGMDIAEIDLNNCVDFAKEVLALIDYRKATYNYVSNKMLDVAPNLKSLIGETVGARLIAHAGSLTNLAKYPASTVQILGAEKALFRALKSRGKCNTPKYGLLFHSTFIGRAQQKNKGRISRFLANKCSIASRIDCFADIPTTVFGDEMKQQVEDRLKYYETGECPSKNVDVMKKALVQAEGVRVATAKAKRKMEKKDKKKREKEAKVKDEEEAGEVGEVKVQKKGKKRALEDTGNSFQLGDDDNNAADIDSAKKKKKEKTKKKHVVEETSVNTTPLAYVLESEGSAKRKKKKQRASE